MELLQPRITLQNTDSSHWLVRLEHQWSTHERVDFQVLIPRSSEPIGHIDRLALQALRAHIDRMLSGQ